MFYNNKVGQVLRELIGFTHHEIVVLLCDTLVITSFNGLSVQSEPADIILH